MSVIAPPPHDDPELLTREARARQRRRRRVAAVAVVLAAAAALVGHAVLHGASKAGRVEGASRTPLTSLPRCRTADLRLAGRFDGAGTGQVRDTFTFTNVSAARCTLRGWPSIRVRLPAGRWAQTRRWSRNEEGGSVLHRQVVLAPGGAASFEVLSSDGVGLSRPCSSVHDLRVAPPGARAALRISYVLGYCEGILVAPVVAGRADHHWL